VRAARVAAAVAGVVLLVLLGAVVVRETVLALDEGLEWPAPAWSDVLTGSPLWTGVAAALLALCAVTFVVLAVRVVTPRPHAVVEFGEGGGSTRADLDALRRLVVRRLEHEVKGLRVVSLQLAREGDEWLASLQADVPSAPLDEVRRYAAAVAVGELRRAGELRLGRFDLEVRRIAGRV
jgi:hypothetical protein